MGSRFGQLAVGVGAAILILAGAASGHEVAEKVETATVHHNETRFCVSTRASTSHGTFGKGGSRGSVYSTMGSACGYRVPRAPGKIKLKFQYVKQSNSGPKVCWGSGWKRNEERSWILTDYATWQVQPCGGGVYRTFAQGGVRIASAWHGTNTTVDSGGHQIKGREAPSGPLPAAGPHGDTIRCGDGEVLQVDPMRDAPPPRLGDGGAPRCGAEGGGLNADPAWVPADVGARHPRTAPKRFFE